MGEGITLARLIMKNKELKMKRKYYSFHTSFRSLKDELRSFLKDNNIYYELSGCISNWDFSVLCNLDELEKINAFLDSITITENKG